MTTFIYPCKGRITSPFGNDILNGQARIHYGIDLAHTGKVPIHAVADGYVSLSYLSESYGECIRVVHYIGGVTYESLYAHMRTGSRRFHNGDKVKQGDVLGYMGDTGYSYGQHLHFELHKGLWNYEKSNAVDPVNYLDGGVKVAAQSQKSGILLTGTWTDLREASETCVLIGKEYQPEECYLLQDGIHFRVKATFGSEDRTGKVLARLKERKILSVGYVK
jgi:Peptidase family M23